MRIPLRTPREWPPEHWWPPESLESESARGWQLALGRPACSANVARLTHELDQLLQSAQSRDAERRCELGIALASALALEAAYSVQLTFVGGPSLHDD